MEEEYIRKAERIKRCQQLRQSSLQDVLTERQHKHRERFERQQALAQQLKIAAQTRQQRAAVALSQREDERESRAVRSLWA